jgi:hypothetical protein
MRIFYIVLISFISLSMHSNAQEKCTWNILKSNCKFQKITDKVGTKVNELGTKINSKGDMISLKIKKEDETLSDKIQSIIKSEK